MRGSLAIFVLSLCALAPRAHADMPLCNRLGPLQASGVIANGNVRETSGVADSRTWPGVLWVHNDSGDQARLFAIDETGADLGEYAVAGAGFEDWEDIGSGPGPVSGANYLYIGDIGDNPALREFVTVYRVREPATAPNGAGGTLAGAEAFEIEYEIGPHDAETLFVDPANGDVYIVTKGAAGGADSGKWIVLRVQAPLIAGTRLVAREVARIDTSQIELPNPPSPLAFLLTSGDVSLDGRFVAGVTQKGDVRIWERPAGGELWQAFEQTPCLMAAPDDVSEGAEAIGFAADLSALYKINETADQGGTGNVPNTIPIHRYGMPLRTPLVPAGIADLPSGGPPALYAAEPALPAPAGWPFGEQFPRTSGTGRLAGGTFFWSDFIYDDNGAFGAPCGNGESAGSPTGGSYCYPNTPAPESLAQRNGADLFRIGVGASASDTWWRIDWNTLVSPRVPIAVFGLDTDDSAATGTPTWPAGAGVRSAGLDAALVVSGTGAWLVTGPLLSQTVAVSSLGGAHFVDTAARSFVVRLPRAALPPSGSWRVRVVSGLADASGQAFAPVPPERGALPGQPPVYNAGYRTFAQEQAAQLKFWQDSAQGQALASGDVSAFSALVDWAQLDAQVNEPEPQPTGLSIRWYVSSLELGQGKALDVGTAADHRPNYIGRVQPYTVYVPTTYQPGTPAPLTWLLHSYTQNHNQYLVSNPNFIADACEARGSICATPLGRGPDLFYLEEAQLDFFEVWNRLAATYSLDPERTVISGYSMGGYGTYLLAMLYPELFARAAVLAGPPGCGGLEVVPGMPLSAPGSTCEAAGATEPMLPNLRWLPTYLAHGGADQLAPIAATVTQVDAIDALGLRHRFDLFPAEDHVGYVIKDQFPAAAEFMGSAPRAMDPGGIDYVFEPVVARPDLGFAPAGAWWVQEAVARDTSLRTAAIHARSLAQPDPAIAELVRTQTPMPGARPSPAVRRELDWVLGAAPMAEPSAAVDLANVGSLALDLARAGLVGAGAIGDWDGDGVGDAADNCPFMANPSQQDSGGVATTAPDGIGDACQCGDVSGNGMVNGQDANAIKRYGLGATPNAVFLVLFNCDVSGNGLCNGQDANAVKRVALGQPSPLFRNGCASFTGARTIAVTSDGPSELSLVGLVPGTRAFLDGASAGTADGDGRIPLSISTGVHEIFVAP